MLYDLSYGLSQSGELDVTNSDNPPSVLSVEWPPDDRKKTIRGLLETRYETHPESETILRRFDNHFAELWGAFTAVYGQDREAATWLLEAVDAAVTAFEERPDSLRSLDGSRGGLDDWFQGPEQVAYMCYVDLFAGDLDGVRERIPYLKELGVTYLHLMPLLESRDGRDDGGYAVTDYRAVDPALGTMADLRRLAAELHEEGIHLALDFVMNHTAREHDWAHAAIEGNERFEDFYITFEDRKIPDQYERTVPEVFPDFAPGNFVHVDEMDRWVWSSFYDFQWDLDYSNPDVFVQMFREMAHLANVGTDVLRLDAVPFLWKELGTDCRNLDESHWLLRAYRALMRIAAPGVVFKAEAIVSPEETIKYLGTGGHEGNECEIAYNAPLMCHLWHALASENTQLLEQALQGLPETPEQGSWLNYVRCHDDIGWGLADDDIRAVDQDPIRTRKFCSDFYVGDHSDSYAEGYRFQEEPTGVARTSGTAAALTGLQQARVEGDPEEIEAAIARYLTIHASAFAMGGMPLLYSGDEVGQHNDYSYLTDPIKSQDNRWIHRPEMDWSAVDRRQEEGSVEQRVFDGIKRLTTARKDRQALHHRADERVLAVANDQVFVVERVHEDERLLAVHNVSGSGQAVDISMLPDAWSEGRFRDVLADEQVCFLNGRLLVEPYGHLWLEPCDEVTRGVPATTTVSVDVETEWGERVFLTGPQETLGEWRLEEAVPLEAVDSSTWEGTVELPENAFVEFEWVKKRDGQVKTWADQRHVIQAGTGDSWRLD